MLAVYFTLGTVYKKYFGLWQSDCLLFTTLIWIDNKVCYLLSCSLFSSASVRRAKAVKPFFWTSTESLKFCKARRITARTTLCWTKISLWGSKAARRTRSRHPAACTPGQSQCFFIASKATINVLPRTRVQQFVFEDARTHMSCIPCSWISPFLKWKKKYKKQKRIHIKQNIKTRNTMLACCYYQNH